MALIGFIESELRVWGELNTQNRVQAVCYTIA